MTIACVPDFIEALKQSGLLTSTQLEELDEHLLKRFSNPKDLAKELIGREWLTPYQVNQLFQKKHQDLVFGPYVILERLGEGGMGQVFKAKHKNLGRIVALKILHPRLLDNETAVKRFLREVEAASKLSHSNIVRAFDADQIDGRHYFAMEYIDGIDLSQKVKKGGPLKVPQACDYIRQAAMGLEHAFQQGLVHRDIKPANLLVTQSPEKSLKGSGVHSRSHLGKWGTVKLLDMGLARITPQNGESIATELTQLGTVMGTPDYIAPEQARNSRETDIRSDIYSLGCTFYFLLTGMVPFPRGNLTEKLLSHQLDDPKPVEDARRRKQLQEGGKPKDVKKLSQRVGQVVRKMMAKKPEDRYQTPQEIVEALTELLSVTAAAGVKSVPKSLPAENPENTPPALDKTPIPPIQALDPPALVPSQVTPAPIALPIPGGKNSWIWKNRIVLGILLGGAALFWLVVLASLLETPKDPGPKIKAESKTKKDKVTELWKEIKKPSADVAAIWEKLNRIRAKQPGSKQADQVAKLFLKIPSPLDKLDPETDLPKRERFLWQPKELVAVYRIVKGFGYHPVSSVAVSPNGRFMVAMGPGNTFFALDTKTRETHKHRLHRVPGQIRFLTFSPSGRELIGGTPEGNVGVWNIEELALKHYRNLGKTPIVGLGFNPAGDRFVGATEQGIVETGKVDGSGGKQVLSISETNDRLTAFVTSPTTNQAICAWANAGLEVLDLEPGQRSRRPSAPTPVPVTSLAFTPDGKTLAAGNSTDGSIQLYRLHHSELTLTKTWTTTKPVAAVAFSPNGKHLVTVTDELRPKVMLWTTSSEDPIQQWHFRWPIADIAFSPDGRHLVTANGNATIFVLRISAHQDN